MTKTTKHYSEKAKIKTDFVEKVYTADRHQTLSHIHTRQEECGAEQDLKHRAVIERSLLSFSRLKIWTGVSEWVSE